MACQPGRPCGGCAVAFPGALARPRMNEAVQRKAGGADFTLSCVTETTEGGDTNGEC